MALCQNTLDGQTWPFPQEDVVRRIHDVLSKALSQAKLHSEGSSQAPIQVSDEELTRRANAPESDFIDARDFFKVSDEMVDRGAVAVNTVKSASGRWSWAFASKIARAAIEAALATPRGET
jgi:hypothetical protein